MFSGGSFYRKNTNRKNGKPYFNPVKEALIDSSDHTVKLEKGHILRNSNLALKEKILSGPSKVLIKSTLMGSKINRLFSLAGKRKLPLQEKAH